MGRSAADILFSAIRGEAAEVKISGGSAAIVRRTQRCE